MRAIGLLLRRLHLGESALLVCAEHRPILRGNRRADAVSGWLVDNAPEMVEQSCRELLFEPHFDQRSGFALRCGRNHSSMMQCARGTLQVPDRRARTHPLKRPEWAARA